METNHKEPSLAPRFTPLGVWAFSIGTSIGWGSFIVTCNTYLSKSGILGTVFGLLVGMAVILVITWNLQIMIRKSPTRAACTRSKSAWAAGTSGFSRSGSSCSPTWPYSGQT